MQPHVLLQSDIDAVIERIRNGETPLLCQPPKQDKFTSSHPARPPHDPAVVQNNSAGTSSKRTKDEASVKTEETKRGGMFDFSSQPDSQPESPIPKGKKKRTNFQGAALCSGVRSSRSHSG